MIRSSPGTIDRQPRGNKDDMESAATHSRILVSALAVIALALSLTPSLAQEKKPSATTNGNCSPVIYGNHNVIDCGKLSKADAATLAEILNEARGSNKSLSEIKDLLKNALDPYRTITTYWPEGDRFDTNNGGGQYTTESAGEHPAFDQFVQMLTDHKWPEMISLAEDERRKAPTWYTVDFFEAAGYAGTCDFARSNQYADKFITEVAENPRYSEMLAQATTARAKVLSYISGAEPSSCHP